MAAPSVNGTGKGWKWVVSVLDADPPELVSAVKEILINSLSLCTGGTENNQVVGLGSFSHGSRNDTLFHVEYTLFKGGMSFEEVTQLAEIFGRSCDPPWGSLSEDEPLNITINSAFKRFQGKERNISQEVEEYVLTTKGNFLTTDVHKNLDLTTRDHKKNVNMILKRLCDDKKVIERYGDKNGSWRKIDRTVVEQCWWEAEGKPLPIRFPLDVEKYAKVFSGNVILLEGQKSQGKSAFAIEFCRLNRKLFRDKPLYQNIEMSNDELTERFQSYEDVMTPDEWRAEVTFIRQTYEWWDKIKPDSLNVVDYLLEYKESYMIADFVWKIHQKLNNGIALVIIQRDPLKPYGTGGRGVRDIPRLVISLIHHKIKLEDVKSFHMSPQGNPTGMTRKYKQASWWKFIPTTEWEFQHDEKYKDFLKGGQE